MYELPPIVEQPQVACLMVTQACRSQMATRAIRAFKEQDYQHKSLIVVSSDDVFPSLGIPFVKAPAGITIGELRNLGLNYARFVKSDLVATWDDDDVSAPGRLSAQVKELLTYQEAEACLLSNMLLAWPDRKLYGITQTRKQGWEPTMMAWLHAMPKYQHLPRGSDSALLRQMLVVGCEARDLYTYVFHGGNIWPPKHFQRMFDEGETFGADDPRVASIRKSLEIP